MFSICKRPNRTNIDRIKVGEVVRLRDLLKVPAEQVCLLTPYRDRLPETEPLSQKVNAHLEAIDLWLQDNGFALVVTNGDKISAQHLTKVHQHLNVWHEAARRIFQPLGCASADRVLVTVVQDPAWPTLVFGEERQASP